MDVFTRRIRGWQLGKSLEGTLTRGALERALLRHVPAIHHSDQGVPYAATDYVDRLRDRGVLLSMAAVGEPRENGYAERRMRTIKEEQVALTEYLDFADALRQLGRFLDEVYNRKRIHSALGYLTPEEFEQQWPGSSAPDGSRRRRCGEEAVARSPLLIGWDLPIATASRGLSFGAHYSRSGSCGSPRACDRGSGNGAGAEAAAAVARTPRVRR
jgi:Integrase core domain